MSAYATALDPERQLCTFSVGEQLFGVDVREVQEVINFQPMTPVPLAPSVIRGLINLRGQIVTALDLRGRLELAPRTDDRLPMNVIVCTDDGPVSLLVDEIGDVLDVDPSTFEVCPRTMRRPTRDLVRAVCKLEGRLLLVLDVTRAVGLDSAGAE